VPERESRIGSEVLTGDVVYLVIQKATGDWRIIHELEFDGLRGRRFDHPVGFCAETGFGVELVDPRATERLKEENRGGGIMGCKEVGEACVCAVIFVVMRLVFRILVGSVWC
jgi:hypothetical protein